MRRIASTRGRNRSAGGQSVSLFPFLAVLICAMGALVLLLVVMTRQAMLQARKKQAQNQVVSSQEIDHLKMELEDVHWRVEQMETSRSQTEKQLADARLRLGHIEEHFRQLQREHTVLLQTKAKLEQTAIKGENRQREQIEQQLARQIARIAEAETQLREAQEAAQKQSNSYLVLPPYQGPNRTTRRPIYIECRADQIILQPEGIALKASDFQDDLGPGNPLAAALRAAREYLQSHQAPDPSGSGEPYPLLLVRPDGIEAYYKARDALKSWRSEFGYELIGDDWNLAFQPSDPGLAVVEREAIDLARSLQRQFADNSSRTFYRVSSGRGGVVRLDGSPISAGPKFASDRSGGFSTRNEHVKSGSRSARGAPGFRGMKGSKHSSASADSKEMNAGDTSADASKRKPSSDSISSSGMSSSGSDTPSLAKTRGDNWGLRRASRNQTFISRPLHAECYADRLILVPESHTAKRKVVSFPLKTVDAVDDLVSAVWGMMDTWGIAGRDMTWSPVLTFHIAPGGQSRFDDLKILLEGSGLEVEQKTE